MASSGDPAIDVGNFMGSLAEYRLDIGDGSALAELPELFLEEYLRESPDQSLAYRARLVECQTLVRKAARRFRHEAHSYARSPGSSMPDRLLGEAEACLANL